MLMIQAKKRDAQTSVSYIKSQGDMPAVVYGQGKVTESITLSQKEFLKMYKEAGESTAISLDIAGASKINALIHATEFDPVKGNPVHADFLIVDMNKSVEVSVPLEFTGVAPAAKSGLGILVKVMHEIEIASLPGSIPHTIAVDVSSLNTLESQITAEQIVLPKGVTLAVKGTEIVCAITPIKEEVESAEPIDLSKIEVAKKGKKEEEVAA